MLLQSPLSEEDQKRNTVYFFFKKFNYNHELTSVNELTSTIKKIKSLPKNHVTV